MKRYILTGTPGSGKTAILRWLEVAGYFVVEEAATDTIALQQAQGIPEPWTRPVFIDDITNLQKQRQMQTSELSSGVQFYDRSPVCTYALSTYLGFPISPTLSKEIERITKDRSIRSRFSLSRIWDSSNPLRQEESALRTRYDSKEFTKKPTAPSVTNAQKLSRKNCPTESKGLNATFWLLRCPRCAGNYSFLAVACNFAAAAWVTTCAASTRG